MADLHLGETLDFEGSTYLADLDAFLDRIGNELGFVDPEPFTPTPLGLLRAAALPVDTSRQSPNFYTPEQVKSRWGLTRTFDEITIHHWGSTGQRFDNVVSWLCNPDAQASSHYVVGGGRISRIVSEANAAWTNGSRAGNARAITIECRPEATDEDYALVADLIRDIRARRGDLPIRPHRVWTSTDCPGEWDLIRLDRLARAGRLWDCTKVMWRGAIQCAHSVPKLDLLALTTPNDIYIQLIQGAFSTSTTASKGTHDGGGAGDTKGSGYSWTQMGVVETAARKLWLLDWRRKYVAGLWSQHTHYLDPECPRLSKAAQSQFYLFKQGYDGLVGDNPDTGWRGNAGEIIRLFENRLTATPTPETSDGTLEGIMALTAKEEEFAQRVANLTTSRTLGRRYPPATDDQPAGATIEAHIFNGNAKSGRNEHALRRVEAALAEISATMLDEGRITALADLIASKIPSAGTVTQEMVTEGIRQAFEEAFSRPVAAAMDDEGFEPHEIIEQITAQEDRHVAFPED